jgi:KaiC/GvpD/RAD55 family RecA-like ATPase
MTDLNSLPLKTAALEYAARGFHVIPCRSRDKVPLVPWKEHQAVAPSIELIESWWSLWPEANIALVMGRGHFAVDVDGADGHEALKAAGITFDPSTPTSLTGRGVHYLLKGNSEDRIGLLPKVDIRGVGIVVVPPSIHASGKQYQWLIQPDMIPDAPESLRRLLQAPPTAASLSPSGPDWVTQAMQGVGEGLRNVTCTRLAGYFLAKGVPPDAVKLLLLQWSARCTPPMLMTEVLLSVESIADREGPHNDEPKTLFDDLMSVGDLYSSAPDTHEWVVEDYIPRGALVMMASEEKVGKSTFMYAMIAAVAHETVFMGRKTVRSPALVLAVEEHRTDVKMRAVKFGLTADDPVKFFVGDLQPDQATYRELRDVVKAMGAGLVILDTLGHHLAQVIESENDNMAAIKAVRPWLHLARETNAAVVIIHHAGKTGAAYRGASAFGGIVDQILTLRHGGGTTRYLESRGRYWDTPRNLKIYLDDTVYRVLGD